MMKPKEIPKDKEAAHKSVESQDTEGNNAADAPAVSTTGAAEAFWSYISLIG